MGQRITVVDAFTHERFRGNPAAVCVLREPADDGWMQSVAAEMNLSETAFVVPLVTENGFRLRWFTPEVEVDLCGHATLATAHVLWELGELARDQRAAFQTRSGLLTATSVPGGIALDFPAEPLREALEPEVKAELESIVGARILFAGRNRMDALVELASEPVVRGLDPDFARLARLPFRGLIATAVAEGPGFDFVSRFFAPAVGVDEDPVCGSAHCFLGPYWGEKLGLTALKAAQVSARGGVIGIERGGPRVTLIGQAITTLRGELV